ncbi:NAD-dependent epimerase/dehydratase family protein [Candidatus Pacearchaeota archaeon]|nr:NAD-dependent epimerase/dehydratase family protein [Candidatus Pacearchaeota archaeon]
MKTLIVTGSAGLIGAETVRFFSNKGFRVLGIDNDMRRDFFGDGASTAWNREVLINEISDYRHYNSDVRDEANMKQIFKDNADDIELIVHTAAQPSHDWAAKDPLTDFTVNANGTLNLLELTRKYCPNAPFIFTSTNKVYGDTPNTLPLLEQKSRWEVDKGHKYFEHGIDESMSIDQSKHSLFGVSKAAADLAVQEYGRYFDMQTVCFRGGCLTGPGHSGTMLHGFLSYLMKCAVNGQNYMVYGYKGKQVRDNIHSFDLVNAFYHFYKNPRKGEVYNIGGSRHSNCSMLEAIQLVESITGNKMNWTYDKTNRSGDHMWWISDVRKFQKHYPGWKLTYNIEKIMKEIYDSLLQRESAQ